VNIQGVLWPLFFIALSPRIVIVFFCVLITLLSVLVGYFLFLYRKTEKAKLFSEESINVRRECYSIMRRMCVCSMVSQYGLIVIGFAVGLLFGNIFGSYWPIVDYVRLDADNLYVLLIVVVSIFITYSVSCYFFRNIIPDVLARTRFCKLCSLIGGGTLLPLHLLYMRLTTPHVAHYLEYALTVCV